VRYISLWIYIDYVHLLDIIVTFCKETCGSFLVANNVGWSRSEC